MMAHPIHRSILSQSRSGGWPAACVAAAICLAVASTALAADDAPKPSSGKLYELRTYTTLPGRLPALHARFKNHTLKLFEKHGIVNVMYWTPTDPKLKENTLIYVVAHDNAEAAKRSWQAFGADPDWKKVRDESEQDGKIVERVESVYMTETEFSPRGK